MFWLKRLASLAAGIGLCFLIDLLAHTRDDYTQRLTVLAGLYVTLSVSLNLINGITGQFSIGHAAFYQIGAYATGFFTVTYFQTQRQLSSPTMVTGLIGVALAAFGASLLAAPRERTPALQSAGKALLAAALAVYVLSWFIAIPFLWYIIAILVAASVWTRSTPDSAKMTIVSGLAIAIVGGLLWLLFAHGPALGAFNWLFFMLFVGAVAAGIAGFVVGLPSLRLRGDYLAIVTMGFGEIIRIEVQNTPALGAAYGLNVSPKVQSIWLVWLLAVVCIAVCRNLIKTAHGLPFLAVREDEVASAAMGVNVTRTKVTAFVIGSMFAGAAGALLAHYEGFITGNFFSMDISFIILTMVVLGGTGSITGSAVAAAFLFYLPEKLRDLKTPQGTTLTVSAASIAAGLIAVVIAVAIIKRVMDHSHRPSLQKASIYAGAVVLAVVSKLLIGAALTGVPAMANLRVEAGQLRMVIFAVTLIVLMLLRPQGIFGHHEFSWTWVKSLFQGNRGKGDGPTPAVAA